MPPAFLTAWDACWPCRSGRKLSGAAAAARGAKAARAAAAALLNSNGSEASDLPQLQVSALQDPAAFASLWVPRTFHADVMFPACRPMLCCPPAHWFHIPVLQLDSATLQLSSEGLLCGPARSQALTGSCVACHCSCCCHAMPDPCSPISFSFTQHPPRERSPSVLCRSDSFGG